MAPVGSYESLMAAVAAGADSVYFGVGQLNMRSRSAANFTLDDLARIVATARQYGVKTYLTVNTILYDDEVEEMRRVVDCALREGVDAVIASDQSAILYARSVGMEVHISTQLNPRTEPRTDTADIRQHPRAAHMRSLRAAGQDRDVRPRCSLHGYIG